MEAQLDLDFFLPECKSQTGLERDTFCLKTCQDYSAVTEAKTLLPWLEKWLGASSTYRQTGGQIPVLLPAREGLSSGQLWTRNSSEWRSGAVVCSLSETLETGEVDRRFFLSSRACQGILRRAEKRQKTLPEQLANALSMVAQAGDQRAQLETIS